MKKKIITLSSLDDVPEGAEFVGERTELIGYNFLVPAEDTQPEPSPDPSPVPGTDFITVANNEFHKNGKRRTFAGTNAYYLPTYENHDQSFCDMTWDLFEQAGINLVRTWAFYDGAPKFDGDPSFQRFENGGAIYNEMGLKCLDRTIAKASERGIYLILTLINYHSDLGGYREYCKAVGIPETFSAFISSRDAQRLYKDYIFMLLSRKNTVTGRLYKNEPSIMAWEICNEARNPGHHPGILRDWYQDIAQFIKSIDSNHLVATGEDGFEDIVTGKYNTEGKIINNHYTTGDYSNTYVLRADAGTSYLFNIAIPEIDFGSFHWYPTSFGFGRAVTPEMLIAQEAWINDHATIAFTVNKPVILGEYGFFVNWLPDLELYGHLWGTAEAALEGTLLWQFVAEGPKLNENGGNISPGRGPYTEFLTHINAMKIT